MDNSIKIMQIAPKHTRCLNSHNDRFTNENHSEIIFFIHQHAKHQGLTPLTFGKTLGKQALSFTAGGYAKCHSKGVWKYPAKYMSLFIFFLI